MTDDLISRQGIIKKAFTVEYTDMWHMTVAEKVVSVKDIEEMPSVTPTERTGHCKDCKWWKDSDGSCGSYICKNYSDWESEDKE